MRGPESFISVIRVICLPRRGNLGAFRGLSDVGSVNTYENSSRAFRLDELTDLWISATNKRKSLALAFSAGFGDSPSPALNSMATSSSFRLLFRAAPSSCWRLLEAPFRNGSSWNNAARLGSCRSFHAATGLSSEEKVTVHFINRDGDKLTAKGKVGDSLLDVVIDNNLDIDGFGACEGTLACSTCHLIFEDHVFEKLDAITDEEMDMLDLAYGLTEKSRLGCQICLKKYMNNMTVRVPEAVADARQCVDMSKNP